MKIASPKSLMLLALGALAPHQTKTIDPFTVAAVAAIGAGVSAGAYMLYDHTHYNSHENCERALKKFHELLNTDETLIRAARNNNPQDLIIDYEKNIKNEHAWGNSLNMTRLTQKLVESAQKRIAEFDREKIRIERYAHYHDYANRNIIERCTNILTIIKSFYTDLESARIYNSHMLHVLEERLIHTLCDNLSKALNNSISTGISIDQRYPLHDHIEDIDTQLRIYRKFLADNHKSSYQQNQIIHHAEKTIESIKRSPDFRYESYEIKIEQLTKEKQALTTTLQAEKHYNRELKRSNNELEAKNSRLIKIIEKIKKTTCCQQCKEDLLILINID